MRTLGAFAIMFMVYGPIWASGYSWASGQSKMLALGIGFIGIAVAFGYGLAIDKKTLDD